MTTPPLRSREAEAMRRRRDALDAAKLGDLAISATDTLGELHADGAPSRESAA